MYTSLTDISLYCSVSYVCMDTYICAIFFIVEHLQSIYYHCELALDKFLNRRLSILSDYATHALTSEQFSISKIL